MVEFLFQSFLLWMWYWKLQTPLLMSLYTSVSILLIVDVVLEASIGSTSSSLRSGFNRSYRGCGTGRFTSIRSLLDLIIVSILLVVDVVLEVAYSRNSAVQALGFNPSCCGCGTGSVHSPIKVLPIVRTIIVVMLIFNIVIVA